MAELAIGDTVKAHYRSGSYIGKIIQDRGDKYLVEVHAVLKHPLQGDLHNYGKHADVFFHERKALAYQEKMNVKKAAVHPYTGDIPAYAESLRLAVEDFREKMQMEGTEFSRQALNRLDELEANHYNKLYRASANQ